MEDAGDDGLDGEVVDALDLIDRLARTDRVRQSMIRQAFRHFLGRNEKLSDSKTLIDGGHAYRESGGSFGRHDPRNNSHRPHSANQVNRRAAQGHSRRPRQHVRQYGRHVLSGKRRGPSQPRHRGAVHRLGRRQLPLKNAGPLYPLAVSWNGRPQDHRQLVCHAAECS
ncbi:MAG: DUF1585 domain-containing protein [Planctomycetales bacterium]|nr:DUF1585 domain-containing protein [Planctomycetales bacterium]